MKRQRKTSRVKGVAPVGIFASGPVRVFLRETLLVVRFFALWIAACALFFQSTLAVMNASAAAGLLDTLALSEICHPDDASGAPIPVQDQAAKKCAHCILCIPGFNVLPGAANALLAVLFLASYVLAAHGIERVADEHSHDHPPARGPPFVA